MRAVACSAGHQIELIELAEPRCDAGEIVLAVEFCGLCGTDLYKLQHDAELEKRVLGHEVVGRVIAAGADVADRFAIGSRVVSPHHVACGDCVYCLTGGETQCPTYREDLLLPGGFSEQVLVRQRATQHAARLVPDHVSSETALFLEPAACVVRGILRAGVGPSSHTRCVVIVGGGSMGLLHLLVLLAISPGTTIVLSDPLIERQHLATELGAAAAVDPASLRRTISELTSGQGADVAFDTVGGPGPLESAVASTRPGGTIVLFAHATPDEPLAFDLNQIFKYERRLIGTYSGSLRDQDLAWQLIESGQLDPAPLVTHKLPFDQFRDAVDLTRNRKALKVLLSPGPR